MINPFKILDNEDAPSAKVRAFQLATSEVAHKIQEQTSDVLADGPVRLRAKVINLPLIMRTPVDAAITKEVLPKAQEHLNKVVEHWVSQPLNHQSVENLDSLSYAHMKHTAAVRLLVRTHAQLTQVVVGQAVLRDFTGGPRIQDKKANALETAFVCAANKAAKVCEHLLIERVGPVQAKALTANL
jgi:hypothetical protein